MRVALLQSDLVWENKMLNFMRFGSMIHSIEEQVDLIVLPEMFTTGFTMRAEILSEPSVASTLLHMQDWAHYTQAAICGSFIAEQGDRFYNRLLWVQPDGSWKHYDKRHLFGLADEPKHYSSGEKRLIVEWKGWRICPLICYDVRFPVWSRNDHSYDMLIYVANFPTRRIQAWNSLLVARAIENQSYTLGVNRTGIDGLGIEYPGESCVIDFEGNTIISKANEDGVLIAELDLEKQKLFRKNYPFLNDQDTFELR